MSLQEKVWWFWLGIISLLFAIMLLPHSNARPLVGNNNIEAGSVSPYSLMDMHLNIRR